MRFLLMTMAFGALFAAVPAVAQGVRDNDRRLNAAEITDMLSGRIVEFHDGSKSRYGADGSYAYTYADGEPPFVGAYTAGDDGRVCVSFENGAARCDHYVMDGTRLILVIADGTRFPVRSLTETPSEFAE